MHHRLLALLLATFICLISAKGETRTWRWQNPQPQGNDLNTVVFANARQGWAAGSDGAIIHTTDGGDTWTQQFCDSVDNFLSACFIDSLTGWVIGEHGILVHTTDGGNIWREQFVHEDMMFVTKVIFTDETNGWVIAQECYHSIDGGETWEFVMLPGFNNRIQAQFLNGQTAWLCALDSVYHTTDGWATWTASMVVPPSGSFMHHLFDMHFVDAQTGWVAGQDTNRVGHLWKTTDGGVTWSVQFTAENSRYLSQLFFHNATYGWTLGELNDWIYRTTDGGANWEPVSSLSYPVYTCFVDSLNGIKVGPSGRIERTTNGGSGWNSVCRSFFTYDLMDVAAVNSQSACAVGEGFWGSDGVIVRTINGGLSWYVADSVSDASLEAIDIEANGIGCAVGRGRTILYTTDFGATWQRSDCPWNGYLLDVQCTNQNNVWAVAGSYTMFNAPGAILHSTTGGLQWEIVHTDSSIGYNGIFCANEHNIWIAGDSGTVLHTTDSGITWEHRDLPDPWRCRCLDQIGFITDQHGWVKGWGLCGWDVVSDATFETTDGGQTWEYWDDDLFDLCIVDSLTAWMVVWNGIISTTDGGLTWSNDRANVGYQRGILGISCSDRYHGWAVGGYGTILRYDSTGLSIRENPGPAAAASFSLSAYPNPFNPSAKIVFYLRTTESARLAIYDVTGRLVKVLNDCVLTAGQHQFLFDGSSLSSGIYFAHLKTATVSKTHKLVLLK